MSIEHHPNVHAVQFAIDLQAITLQEQRCPTQAEIHRLFLRSMRGQTTFADLDIVDELCSEFIECINTCLHVQSHSDVRRHLVNFIIDVSSRLDARHPVSR
jgi:hypothetical protein